ncbi:MFS transporter [Mycobacterium sp. M1]|uniref:MFS transporter n=1 Tax=Mycolicibacter acidiphilus TaxID=2835306 RepID=A0ABS5RFJ1_9MYCO|nr:MFS transporter [Mycolicibacter acidiphilus]MBS9532434.1 MFS transporter [Mycolicibacter acidiphilus]
MSSHDVESEPIISAARRWFILAITLAVTACSFLFINCGVFLIPALQADRNTSLTQAGLLSAMPSFGMVVTLVGWGYLVDRLGERVVLTAGSALTAVAAFAAAPMHSLTAMGALLFLGGMAAASCNTAGGRVVSGWFPAHQRGLAMGIRQTAQPLGVAIGAVAMPELTEVENGFFSALLIPAIACAVAAVASAVFLTDPPRVTRATATEQQLANPYRKSHLLQRIHLASALLMVPQSMTVTFMLVWLIRGSEWSVPAASALMTVAQLLGALARIGVGRWSDRVGSRLRPKRMIAVACSAALLLLALTDYLDSALAETAMVLAAVVAVGYNGLSATAITEYAGPFWSGRALGAQNTFQRLTAAVVPPAFGALITAVGYPVAFAVCALFPLAAAPLVPVKSEPGE